MSDAANRAGMFAAYVIGFLIFALVCVSLAWLIRTIWGAMP